MRGGVPTITTSYSTSFDETGIIQPWAKVGGILWAHAVKGVGMFFVCHGKMEMVCLAGIPYSERASRLI